MPIEPTGSCVVWPPLTDGQVDSLVQRIEDAWGVTMHATVNTMAGFLLAVFPEQYAGDADAAAIDAAAIRERANGLRSMPNGHLPDYERDE